MTESKVPGSSPPASQIDRATQVAFRYCLNAKGQNWDVHLFLYDNTIIEVNLSSIERRLDLKRLIESQIHQRMETRQSITDQSLVIRKIASFMQYIDKNHPDKKQSISAAIFTDGGHDIDWDTTKKVINNPKRTVDKKILSVVENMTSANKTFSASGGSPNMPKILFLGVNQNNVNKLADICKYVEISNERTNLFLPLGNEPSSWPE